MAVSAFGLGESPSLEDGISQALAVMAGRKGKRDAGGRCLPENTAKADTYERSEGYWEAVAPIRSAIVARVLADQALEAEHAPETLARLMEAFAEATLLRQSLFMRCVQDGGPITSKRRTSAVYTAYLAAMDRETKLAGIIGLERKARPVDARTPEEYILAQQRKADTQ